MTDNSFLGVDPLEGIPILRIFLFFFVFVFLFEFYLDTRQYFKYKINKRPSQLVYVTDADFAKAQAYGLDKSLFGLFLKCLTSSWSFFLIFYFVYPALWKMSENLLIDYGITISSDNNYSYSLSLSPFSFQMSLSQTSFTLLNSVLFFIFDHFLDSLISLGPNLYSTFVIEQKHGFNKQTLALFFIDLIKSELLYIIIGTIILLILLSIITFTGPFFYIYLSVALFLIQLLAVLIYPTLIQPCFNKVEPLEQGALRQRIEELAQQLKFPLKQLFVIDGSKRSAHSNAYFYGFCNSKRIVLFDTLINQSSINEVVAVLAHELGHWKKSHNLKNIVIMQITTLFQFWLFGMVCNSNNLFIEFGFPEGVRPAYIGLMLFSCIYSPVSHFLSFLMNLLSRHFEFQADEFAVSLGHGSNLKSALLSLHRENKGTMIPDSLYSAYHYSHPPLLERITAIENSIRFYESKKLD